MPQHQKGPRLYLRRYRDRAPTWIIRDGERQLYLGLTEDRQSEAEDQFRNYVNGAHEGRPDSISQEMAPLLRRTRPGVVYFATCDVPLYPIKIGFAVNLRERIQDLQVAMPWRLKVLGIKRGDPDTERALHRQFASLRLLGEWFARGPDLLDHIKTLDRSTRIWPSHFPKRARKVKKPVALYVAPNFRQMRE